MRLLCLLASLAPPVRRVVVKSVTELATADDYEKAISSDELVVIKFFAPWCRACRGLEPKYKRISTEYSDVSFYELSYKDMAASDGGQEFLTKNEINVLPLVHFYKRGQRVEAFPCGPRKIELLRSKLQEWHNKVEVVTPVPPPVPPVVTTVDVRRRFDDKGGPNEVLDSDDKRVAVSALRYVPFFRGVDDIELEKFVAGARTASYNAGDVLVAEGEVGRRFFVLLTGECDVYQLDARTSTSHLSGYSPDATRSAFGARTNVLSAGDFFGERGLVENRPRVASIVAATHVKALVLERSALAEAGLLDKRLGVWGYEMKRSPVDNEPPAVFAPLGVMQRLRLVRSVVRAFDQAASRNPSWGDANEIKYRNRLVAQLTDYQRLEFEQTFELLDKNKDGTIEVDELRDLMRAFGRSLPDNDLADMINKANPEVEGNLALNKDDFLALMAQAEFSSMFLEAFKLLDPHATGFLESEQLWTVLQTLVGDDFPHLDKLADQFGVDDGVIDYAAFVRIMLNMPLKGAATSPS